MTLEYLMSRPTRLDTMRGTGESGVKRHACLPKLVIVGLALTFGSAFGQSTQVGYTLSARSVSVPNTRIENPAGTISDSVGDGGASASTSLLATYGVLKARGEAIAITDPYGFSAFTSVSSSFRDSVNIANPVLTGQIGYALINVDYSWSLLANAEPRGAGGHAQAAITLQFAGLGAAVSESHSSVLGQNSQTYSGLQIGPSTTVQLDIARERFAVWIPFYFGFDQPLSMELSAVASAGSNSVGGGHGSFDASHSAYWGGLSAVTDAGGNAVEFTLESASGTDYSKSFSPITAVPEPTTYALTLVGCGLILFTRRRACTKAASASDRDGGRNAP